MTVDRVFAQVAATRSNRRSLENSPFQAWAKSRAKIKLRDGPRPILACTPRNRACTNGWIGQEYPCWMLKLKWDLSFIIPGENLGWSAKQIKVAFAGITPTMPGNS